MTASRPNYSRDSLLRLSYYPKSVIETHIFEDLKRSGLFTYRSKRGGGRKIRRHAIPVLVTKRPVERHMSISRGCNHNNLTRIKCSQIKISSTNPITEEKYAVPKCMFLNICSLTKTQNGIKANLALEADLFANDIDICVVSETHLKRIVPDSVVAISNYTTHRRDRNWFDNDEREKGGVAIYVRKNVKVKSVSRSELFESISLEIELPSGHHMLMCGIYHPPRSKYQEDDLIEYITDIVDQFLECHPNGLVLCGGDLNRLDLEKLSNLSGLKALVDFPTRGNSVLDNCLTNNEALFSRCYPIVAQMKTDHKGVILPAGVRLKPLRFSCTMRDYREHRKSCFIISS